MYKNTFLKVIISTIDLKVKKKKRKDERKMLPKISQSPKVKQ